jgi:hypothetical protein
VIHRFSPATFGAGFWFPAPGEKSGAASSFPSIFTRELISFKPHGFGEKLLPLRKRARVFSI